MKESDNHFLFLCNFFNNKIVFIMKGEKIMPYLVNDQTYEDIIEKYCDMVTRICIVNLRNSDDAKDCFQNIFIKLYQSHTIFQSEEHLKAWLIRVSVNECKNYQKIFYRTVINIDDVIMKSSDQKFELLYEVLKLPNKQRNVLYLYYYEGYQIKEIANILSMKENTIKSHLKRGREELKRRIGEFYE